MEGSRACQLPILAWRELWALHTAKHIMRLSHASMRSARRWLSKGFVPKPVARRVLPILDDWIERRIVKLRLLHHDIERAEIALGLRPTGPHRRAA